jgi:hypothetical protein
LPPFGVVPYKFPAASKIKLADGQTPSFPPLKAYNTFSRSAADTGVGVARLPKIITEAATRTARDFLFGIATSFTP